MSQIRRRKWFRFVFALATAGGLLLLPALFMPDFDGPRERNEAAAVKRMRAIAPVEKRFAAAHADKGFACESPTLKEAQRQGYDEAVLLLFNGIYGGYRFALSNCRTDAKGVVVHYQATAVPLERGKTGFRAFCTDDSGLLWYDLDGSGPICLKSRRVLPE